MSKQNSQTESIYSIFPYLKKDSLLPIYFFYGDDFFTIDNADFSDEFNLFKEQYFSDIHRSGINNLLLVIHDDAMRNIYQEELHDFNTNSGLKVEF